MLVPNVEDITELTQHIRVLLYISAGVATGLFILVIIGKTCSGVGEEGGGRGKGCWSGSPTQQEPTAGPSGHHWSPRSRSVKA